MNIQFRQGSEELQQKTIDRAQDKLTRLSRYIEERNFEAQAYVDVERESGANKSESMWRASVNLDVGGDHFNASETGDTPEKAIDLALKELKREVQDTKSKHQSVIRRSGGLLKSLRRGFK